VWAIADRRAHRRPETLSNPTVGLAAHSGQVDVRITAKAGSEAEADPMIAEIEANLRQRLGDWVYGADQEALEQMALDHLGARAGGWRWWRPDWAENWFAAWPMRRAIMPAAWYWLL
jgi:hypothetical protein